MNPRPSATPPRRSQRPIRSIGTAPLLQRMRFPSTAAPQMILTTNTLAAVGTDFPGMGRIRCCGGRTDRGRDNRSDRDIVCAPVRRGHRHRRRDEPADPQWQCGRHRRRVAVAHRHGAVRRPGQHRYRDIRSQRAPQRQPGLAAGSRRSTVRRGTGDQLRARLGNAVLGHGFGVGQCGACNQLGGLYVEKPGRYRR